MKLTEYERQYIFGKEVIVLSIEEAQAHDARLAALEDVEKAARTFILTLDESCLDGVDYPDEIHTLRRWTQRGVYDVTCKHFGDIRNRLKALAALDALGQGGGGVDKGAGAW